MKAFNPPIERETIIIFNDGEDVASFYTASPTVYRHMLKKKWVPTEENHVDGVTSSAWFEVSKKSIGLPRQKKKMSEAALSKLRARMSKKGLK